MDEDAEFREMITKKLEATGFLQKMRVSLFIFCQMYLLKSISRSGKTSIAHLQCHRSGH